MATWLKQAVVAKQKLLTISGNNDDVDFYESKIHTMQYFFHYEIPKTQSLRKHILMDEEVLTMTLTEKEMVM